MATYEQFKTEVINNIMDYLTEDYQDYIMKVQTIQKSGYEYEGLIIEPKVKNGMNVVPALNLTEAYKQYESGIPFDNIISKLADIRMTAAVPNFKKEDLLVFNKIKDRIMPRLINTDTNRNYLSDKPHKEVENLSIMYAVRLTEDSQGFADAVITYQLIKTWGVTEQEIHEAAVKNISEIKPYFVNLTSIFEDFFNDNEGLIIEDIEISDYDMPFFILSNKYKTKGAVMITIPEVMDKITDKLGKIYIIPSSVDEVIIVPQSTVDNVEDLVKMVKQVNVNEVRPEDQLSDNIYEYDIDKHSICIVG